MMLEVGELDLTVDLKLKFEDWRIKMTSRATSFS